MKTLVGSVALSMHMPVKREFKDIDYFSDSETCSEVCGLRVESFWHPSLGDWPWRGIASLDELYTIKVSHSFWELKNGTWAKHMFDILQMKRNGAVLIPELYDILYGVWEDTHGRKRANLEATPEEFFNKSVKRVYDHDSIHASVAYYDEPLFNAILRDGSQVSVDRSKFEALSQRDKDRLVYEEAYATALERLIIPSDYEYNQRAAFDWAIKKTVTSFSKGWFPLYIVDNFDRFTKPDIDYVKRHLDNKDKLVVL